MIKLNDLFLKKKIPEISHLDLTIENGESYVLLSSGDNAVHHLDNIFSGVEQGFKGTVEIDNINIISDPESCLKNLAFLNSGPQWPNDMKTGSIISFFKKRMNIPVDKYEELYIKLDLEHINGKKISEQEEVIWRKILFSLTHLKKSKNYIIHDFAKGMPLDFTLEFKRNLNRLKKEGCSILYFSDDVFFAPEIGDRIGFMKKGKLLLELHAEKMKRMSLQELYFQFLAEQ
jgi:ABC-type Na+ transport system ATPase subunit NatA